MKTSFCEKTKFNTIIFFFFFYSQCSMGEKWKEGRGVNLRQET